MSTNTPKKKRAILIRNAYSFDFGGGERFPIYLAQELEKNGWEATVVSAHKKLRATATQRGVASVRGWWWSKQDWSGANLFLTPLYLLWQVLLTLWYIQLFMRLRPDVIHAQSKDDFIAATIAGRTLGKRIIWTDHADLKYIYENVDVWYKNPIGKMVRFCSRLAYAITLVSKSELALIEQSLKAPIPRHYTVAYNGITEFTPPTIDRDKSDKQAVVFCATSRLVTAKGIGELIDAFKQINTDGTMRLWLLGEGPEEATFKTQAKGDPSIRFLGFPETSYSILQSADIFVHPSYHEGFSLSLIEASMLGKPIIACNVGGNPEIIHDTENGLLIPPKNTAQLAEAMATLAHSSTLRKQYGAAARQTFDQHFRFNTIVKEQFIALYEK